VKSGKNFERHFNGLTKFLRAITGLAGKLARGLQYPLGRANPARPVGWRAADLRNLRYGDFKMVRVPTLIAAAFAVCITSAAYAAPAASEMAAEIGQTLTLGSAKQMVADKLKAAGQSTMRPGHAELDADGNVKVEIVNLQGLPVSHVLVHANGGQITDAAATKKRG
jgi:uncharacterized membrane protein